MVASFFGMWPSPLLQLDHRSWRLGMKCGGSGLACGALGELPAKRNPAYTGAECGERWTAKRAVLPKRPVLMLRIVVIDKDRLCAQGKAAVPRLLAKIESIVEVGAFLSFGRLP